MRRFLSVIIIIVLAIGNGSAFFYYENIRLPRERDKAVEEYKETIGFEYIHTNIAAKIKEGATIEKYSVISQRMAEELIEFVPMPVVALSGGSISDISELVGQVAKEKLSSGELILQSALTENKQWFEDYDRIKDYEIKTDLGGTLEEGMIVDIIVVYDNGDYDVVVPKQKILKLNEDNLARVENTTSQNDVEIIVSIPTEEDYRDMVLAGTMGKFELRRYHDESQPASKKPLIMIEWLKLRS